MRREGPLPVTAPPMRTQMGQALPHLTNDGGSWPWHKTVLSVRLPEQVPLLGGLWSELPPWEASDPL